MSELYLIIISKKEMEYLTKNGIRFVDGGLIVTTSRHSGKTYFLTESERNLKLLEKYRQSIIVK